MIRTVKTYKLFESYTGMPHEISITKAEGVYRIHVDTEYYFSADNMRDILDEAENIVIENNWLSFINR